MEPTQDSNVPQQTPPPQQSGAGIWTAVIVIIILAVAGFAWYKNSQMNKVASSQNTQNTAQTMDGNSDQAMDTSGTMQPSQVAGASTSTAATTTTQNMTPGEKDFTINGGMFYFKPNQITVSKGDKVKITFVNDNGFHDFVIDEFNVKTARIQGGQSATVEFTADKTGSFDYYCSVGNHRAQGMQGVLTVQ